MPHTQRDCRPSRVLIRGLNARKEKLPLGVEHSSIKTGVVASVVAQVSKFNQVPYGLQT